MMKKLFTILLLSLALTLQAADKVWCMVTDDGTKIALSRIGFLLVSDQSDALFCAGRANRHLISYNRGAADPAVECGLFFLAAQRLSTRYRHHDLRCERKDGASGGAAVRWYDLYCWPACWYLCPEGWFGKCEVLEEVTPYTENHDEKEISTDDSLYGGFLCGSVTVRNRADRW